MKIILLCFLFTTVVYAKIQVGVILPTTGPFSSSVCVIQKAAALNKDIDLKVYNSGNSLLGVIESTTMALNDDLDYIIGPRTSQEALSMLDLLKTNKKIISVIPMASHPEITNKYSRTIRMIPSSTFYASKMANLIKSEISTKKLIVITNISLPYSEEYTKLITSEKALKDFSINQINVISGQINSNNLKEIISNKSMVGLYLPLYTSEATSIIKQIIDTGIKVKIFTHGGTLDGVDQYKAMLKASKATVFINNIWSGHVQNSTKSEYLKLASECKTNPMEFRTLVSYDSLKLIEKKHRSQKNELNFNVDYRGVLSNYRFDSNRNAISNFYVLKINSKGSLVYEIP